MAGIEVYWEVLRSLCRNRLGKEVRVIQGDGDYSLCIGDDELSSIAGMDNFAHYVHGFSDAMALFDVGGDSVTVNKRSMASLKDLYLNSDYRQQANILAVLDCIGAKEAIYALFEEK